MRHIIALLEANGELKSLSVKKSDYSKVVSDMTLDSRDCKAGSLFFAQRGHNVDGLRFVKDAIRRGAVLVIADRKLAGTVRSKWGSIRVKDVPKALGLIVAAFYRYPSNRTRVYGITGTNGKTTTAYLVQHILMGSGIKTSLAGTVTEIIPGRRAIESLLTTHDCLHVNSFLDRTVESGCLAAVCEVSSHALQQRRVWGVKFDTVLFTNLTQDHLDYHSGMENYYKEKEKLFTEYSYRKAVVNSDDPYGRRLARKLRAMGKRVVTYGTAAKSDVRLISMKSSLQGSRVSMSIYGKRVDLRLKLIGEYNIYNAAAAIAATEGDVSFVKQKRLISSAVAPPGRMEQIDAGQNFTAIVDYAHTPDSVEKLLVASRKLKPRRLITVFGCGGDRDRTKRPLMARAASRMSDITIATSDNPRTEDAGRILKDVSKGLRGKASKDYFVIQDRREALKFAAGIAKRDDAVVVAGKGHETYQIIGTKKYPFDDRNELRKAIKLSMRKKAK